MGHAWLSKEPSKVLQGEVSPEHLSSRGQQFTIRPEAASEDPTFPISSPPPHPHSGSRGRTQGRGLGKELTLAPNTPGGGQGENGKF